MNFDNPPEIDLSENIPPDVPPSEPDEGTRVEGVWSIEVGDGVSFLPGGVLVLDGGRVRGGDSGYYYFGTYEREPARIVLSLDVSHYRAQRPSVWGEGGESFALIIRGSLGKAGTLILGGTDCTGNHPRRIVRLRKRAPLQ